MFQSPQKRNYRICLSSSALSALDSVTLEDLNVDSRVGLIGRELSKIEDLSTSGFFDMLSWYFKQLSKRGKNKVEKDAELKTLEVGLGYQLLELRKENDEKLVIENWKDPNAYAYYFKHHKKRYMDAETIQVFLYDLPVYATHNYK
jgi:hypothetical protein